MKKLLGIIGVIILIGAIATAGFFIWKNNQPKPVVIEPSGEVIEKQPGLAELTNVVPVSIKENASSVNRVVNVTYPSVQSFANKNFQKYVNDSITSVIFAYRDEINAIVDEKTDKTNLYTYESSYDKYACEDYLSLVISNRYETGGIRSNQWKDTYNINVRTERLIYLADIFPANVNYQQIIVEEINKQAKEKGYELMNGEGLKGLDEKQKFYIRNDKLMIYFDAAAIAPATYGDLEFEMPFTLDTNLKFNP